MQKLQLVFQVVFAVWIRYEHAEVAVSNQQMTDLLEKAALELGLVLKCNSYAANACPSALGRSSDNVVLVKKDCVEEVVIVVTLQLHRLRDGPNYRIFVGEHASRKLLGIMHELSRKNLAALGTSSRPKLKKLLRQSRCIFHGVKLALSEGLRQKGLGVRQFASGAVLDGVFYFKTGSDWRSMSDPAFGAFLFAGFMTPSREIVEIVYQVKCRLPPQFHIAVPVHTVW